MIPAAPYREVLGTVEGLRRGYTTGATAAAACAAAVIMLRRDGPVDSVEIELPGKGPFGGRRIAVPVEVALREGEGWTAGIRKDSGDDEDATNGILILCFARDLPDDAAGAGEILIKAGQGVGRVTRPGLPVPPGQAAINPVPLRMIRAAVRPHLLPGMTLELLVSVPEGEKIARETWNPRLGIVGGISLIGTSGVVEPKSTKAFQSSIALCIRQASLSGRKRIIITLGHVGSAFLERRRVPEEASVLVGDHVGFALDRCLALGIMEIVLAGHVGKLAKVAAGIFDTHWSSGDARLETLAACAAACGAGAAVVREILALETAEAAEAVIRKEGLEVAYTFLAARAASRMGERAGSKGFSGASTACVVLSLSGEALGASQPELMEEEAWRYFR